MRHPPLDSDSSEPTTLSLVCIIPSHPLTFVETMQSNTFCVGNGSKSLTGKEEKL